jgi:hypothetical protein
MEKVMRNYFASDYSWSAYKNSQYYWLVKLMKKKRIVKRLIPQSRNENLTFHFSRLYAAALRQQVFIG